MKTKAFLAFAALAAMSSFTAPKAEAWVTYFYWKSPQIIRMQLHFEPGGDVPPITGPLSDGTRDWYTPAIRAIEEWNSYINGVQISPSERATFTPKWKDDINSMSFSKRGYTAGFPVGYEEITYIVYMLKNDSLVEADTIFNANLKWDCYKGEPRRNADGETVDFYRVALRAVGASFGLGSPDQNDQDVPAIMNRQTTALRSLTKDDVEGLRSLYDGSKRPLPPVNGSDQGGGGGNGIPDPIRVKELPTISSVKKPTSISSTEMAVSGTVTRNAPELSYLFEYDTSPYLFRNTTKAAVLPAGLKVPVKATLKNLKPGTKYYYRIKVFAKYGNYSGAMENGTTLLPVATAAKASGVKTTSASLSGSVTPKGPGLTAEIQIDTAAKGAFKKSLGVKKLANSTKPIKISGNATKLSRNKTYYYRIAVKGNGKTVYSSVRNFKTLK